MIGWDHDPYGTDGIGYARQRAFFIPAHNYQYRHHCGAQVMSLLDRIGTLSAIVPRRIRRRFYNWVLQDGPDILAIQLLFLEKHHRFANLLRSRTFSELCQVRKLAKRDLRFSKLSDKICVKEQVAAELGPEWLIPTLWSGSVLPPRDLRTWPLPYVLKSNHGSGWNLFVRKAPTAAEWTKIEARVSDWLDSKYGRVMREHHYDRIEPRLLVEPMIGEPGSLPIDYKFFCFGGRVEFVMVQSERHKKMKIATMDREWNLTPLKYGYERPLEPPAKPASFDSMLKAAETLSSPFDFVRMDFYEIDGRPLFGEYTFIPGSGLETFEPQSFNHLFGELWRDAIRTRRRSLASSRLEGADRVAEAIERG